ncbi:serine protease [Corynebacterium sp. HS2168-gen11]|uniref:serine protease n=1 Tax=Corynebacterium sp. HS2168-gen11 TaxID=2974027 RepID=UPI00216B2BFB|nr:serine protease [Corynebacterium sp. HS2168-gen11]MCS4535074.1 serine protease [Corynebacterium sp. HS2168-gen11]
MQLHRSVLRISSPSSHASAVAVADDLVLTARHFLRKHTPDAVWISSRSQPIGIVQWIDIPGTDIAVALTHTPIPQAQPASLAPTHAWLGSTTVSFGYAGGVITEKPGRIIGWLPIMTGRRMGLAVSPATLIFQPNPAIRGDSGGPIFCGTTLVALQSMITDPFGYNLKIATGALIRPHLGRIKRAMSQLQQLRDELRQ